MEQLTARIIRSDHHHHDQDDIISLLRAPNKVAKEGSQALRWEYRRPLPWLYFGPRRPGKIIKAILMAIWFFCMETNINLRQMQSLTWLKSPHIKHRTSVWDENTPHHVSKWQKLQIPQTDSDPRLSFSALARPLMTAGVYGQFYNLWSCCSSMGILPSMMITEYFCDMS